MAITYVQQRRRLPVTSLPRARPRRRELRRRRCALLQRVRRHHHQPADTAGNSYVSTGLRIADFSGSFQELWVAQNVAAHAAAVITVTFSGAVSFVAMGAGQYAGMRTSGAVDVTASGVTSIGGPVTSGAFTTTQADALIVLFASVTTTATSWSTAGAPFKGTTIRGQDASHVLVLADEIVSTVQTGVSARMVNSNTVNDKTLVVVTLKAATAAAAVASAQPYIWMPA